MTMSTTPHPESHLATAVLPRRHVPVTRLPERDGHDNKRT